MNGSPSNTFRRSNSGSIVVKTLLLMSILLTGQAYGNVLGGETQNFSPTPNGIGFMTVHSSETLAPYSLNLGMFIDQATNTLPVFAEGDVEQSRTSIHDSLTSGNMHIGYGVKRGWEIGLSLPQLFGQQMAGGNEHRGQFSDAGATGARLSTKVRVWKNSKSGVAIAGSYHMERIRNNPYEGEGSSRINLEVIADRKIKKHLVAANVGMSLGQKQGTSNEDDATVVEATGNRFIWSTAGNYTIKSKISSIIVEAYGSMPTGEVLDESNRVPSSAELLTGYRHSIPKNRLSMYGSVGTEIINGRATPDWRFIAGLNWKIGLKKKRPQPTIAKDTIFNEGPLGPIKKKERITVNDVLFKFNSAELDLRGKNTSAFKLAEHLRTPPVYKQLVIVGHTDAVGSDNYNQKLSRKRAQTLRNWLVHTYNLDPQTILTVGKGESQPIDTNKTDAGRQKNRRVEFKIFR